MLQDNFTNFQNIQCIKKYLVFDKVDWEQWQNSENVIKYDNISVSFLHTFSASTIYSMKFFFTQTVLYASQ